MRMRVVAGGLVPVGRGGGRCDMLRMRCVPWACAVLCLFSACAGSGKRDAARSRGAGPLDGAWRLVALKSAGAEELTRAAKDNEHVKFITGGRFVWMNLKDGKITSACAGTCSVRGDRYTERPESTVLAADKWLVGKKLSFQWKLDGDKWRHTGVIKGPKGDEEVCQVWQRMR